MSTITEITTQDGARLSVHLNSDRGAHGTPSHQPTILLISGLGGTAGFWKPVIAAYETGIPFVSLDQRGIGASSRGHAAVTIHQLALDCLSVLDELNIKACTVIGHSTGGCIAQELAVLAPDRIKGLVLSATWLKADPYIEALFAHRRALLEQNPRAYAGLGAMMGYPPQWLTTHWSVYETALRQCPETAEAQAVVRERIAALLAYDGHDNVSRIACPTLTIGSADDAIIPLTQQIILHQALSSRQNREHCHLHSFDQGGHFFPVSRTADFCEVVANWHRGLS